MPKNFLKKLHLSRTRRSHLEKGRYDSIPHSPTYHGSDFEGPKSHKTHRTTISSQKHHDFRKNTPATRRFSTKLRFFDADGTLELFHGTITITVWIQQVCRVGCGRCSPVCWVRGLGAAHGMVVYTRRICVLEGQCFVEFLW